MPGLHPHYIATVVQEWMPQELLVRATNERYWQALVPAQARA